MPLCCYLPVDDLYIGIEFLFFSFRSSAQPHVKHALTKLCRLTLLTVNDIQSMLVLAGICHTVAVVWAKHVQYFTETVYRYSRFKSYCSLYIKPNDILCTICNIQNCHLLKHASASKYSVKHLTVSLNYNQLKTTHH